MAVRIAVCLSGRGSNLSALLDALPAGGDVVVSLVISNRENAAGLELAAGHGIPTRVLAEPGDASAWLAVLRRHEVDLIVLAGFLALVPAGVVEAYRDRMINIHPALLPRHGGRGMYGRRVHAAVLAAGDTETGATVHLVTEEYDRGQILGQAAVPVLEGDTPESLAARVLGVEHRLLPAAVLAAGAAGHPVPFSLTPQGSAVRNVPCPAP
ncbi:MAG: phosphoribosylglycinamide formyltransferase [Gemmatimonadota bacterium]|nr:phosphoribosylglycinamide formyltransferase [Gemmatimonadota bacterium]